MSTTLDATATSVVQFHARLRDEAAHRPAGDVGDVDPAIYSQVVARLSDFGELRLAAMDRAGIARSVLSLVRGRATACQLRSMGAGGCRGGRLRQMQLAAC